MTKLPNREALFQRGMRCVEVGTRVGDLASVVLDRTKLTLTVVDSWEGQFADAEAEARAKLGGRAAIIKARSVEASKQFENESLDLVYIDAAHDFESVCADIKAWYPKVKSGGILAGHDYEDKPDDGYWGPIEVKRAVDSVFNTVNVIDENPPSWWVVKS